MDFQYGDAFTESARRRTNGWCSTCFSVDSTLFPNAEEVEASWRVIDPLEEAWAGTVPFPYRAGEWGTAGGRRDARPRR